MKWEPIAAMLALVALGFWVVWGPTIRHEARPGSQLSRVNMGGVKGELEVLKDAAGDVTLRFLYRDGAASPRTWTGEQFASEFGGEAFDTVTSNAGNPVFRALNVTGWWGLAWVVVGFAGQAAFFGRMALQWVVSERERRSVVPASFWYLSLLGGVLLFAYFAWRQDIVGVIGQTSGIVIYARNIRLIGKQRRRESRAASASAAPAPAAGAAARPEAGGGPGT